jgi:precorrin-6B methylase 1
MEQGMEKVHLTVGENLSYPEERIRQGTPRDFLGEAVSALSVVLIER